jgi:hypothetical protein
MSETPTITPTAEVQQPNVDSTVTQQAPHTEQPNPSSRILDINTLRSISDRSPLEALRTIGASGADVQDNRPMTTEKGSITQSPSQESAGASTLPDTAPSAQIKSEWSTWENQSKSNEAPPGWNEPHPAPEQSTPETQNIASDTAPATSTTELSSPPQSESVSPTAPESLQPESPATNKEAEVNEKDLQVEAALNVHNVMSKIESINPNFDANSDMGKTLIKDLIEYPDYAEKVTNLLNTAEKNAQSTATELASQGFNIDSKYLAAVIAGNLTEQLMGQLDIQQEQDAKDPSKADEVQKRSVLIRILKALGKVALIAGSVALGEGFGIGGALAVEGISRAATKIKK